jgi:hypothetical protein
MADEEHVMSVIDFAAALKAHGTFTHKKVPVKPRKVDGGAPAAPAGPPKLESVVYFNMKGFEGKPLKFMLGNPAGGPEYQPPYLAVTPTPHALAANDDSLSVLHLVPDDAECAALQDIKQWIRNAANAANATGKFLCEYPKNTEPVADVSRDRAWRESFLEPSADDATRRNVGISLKWNIRNGRPDTKFLTYRRTGDALDLNDTRFDNTRLCTKGKRCVNIVTFSCLRENPKGWQVTFYSEEVWLEAPKPEPKPMTRVGGLAIKRNRGTMEAAAEDHGFGSGNGDGGGGEGSYGGGGGHVEDASGGGGGGGGGSAPAGGFETATHVDGIPVSGEGAVDASGDASAWDADLLQAAAKVASAGAPPATKLARA